MAGQRRDHQVERVGRRAAVRLGIGQRLDDLELLDDRARPAVRDDHRQRILVLRADVQEVDVDAVDLGEELRERVEPRLDLAPVVLRRPVVGEGLHRRELHALRGVARRSPCVGHRVARMRRLRSSSSSCGISTRNGRMARVVGGSVVTLLTADS